MILKRLGGKKYAEKADMANLNDWTIKMSYLSYLESLRIGQKPWTHLLGKSLLSCLFAFALRCPAKHFTIIEPFN